LLDYREYPVLYVDDEPENLRIFELAFRRDFSIVTAASGEEGLRTLYRQPIALVLSDHRMPGMTGVDFLTRVRELDPKTIRVLVTAYGDAETLGVAINDGSIYRYVPKPWEADELRLTIKRSIEVYALDREREALVRELTAVNQIAQTINQELDLGPLLDQLLHAITEELGFDAAAILFLDDDREHLRIDRLLPADDPVSEEITREAICASAAPAFMDRLLDGEAQILNVAKATDYEAPIRRLVVEVAADEILVVPLVGKKGVIGAIAVDNRRGGAAFTVADRTLLEGLATQAAIAIDNARLVEDLRRSRQQVLRADRLGTLGTLAAGLAHEINNPLVSVHTFLSLAASKRAEDDEEFWDDYYRLACQEVDRIRGLVATMSRLGRSGVEPAARVSCEPLALVEEVATLMAPEAAAAEVEIEVVGGDGGAGSDSPGAAHPPPECDSGVPAGREGPHPQHIGRTGRPRGSRHRVRRRRPGDRGGGSREDLRSLLHDQGAGSGQRSRSHDLSPDHRRPSGHDRGFQLARGGRHLPSPSTSPARPRRGRLSGPRFSGSPAVRPAG
jgi:CheY-like chemotaxis protein